MAFLDLQEALVDLGYGTAVDRRELTGFRFYGTTPRPITPERREYKRKAQARYQAVEASLNPPTRAYHRHPVGTPRWKKGDQGKRKARARASIQERRTREREERMMTARTRFQDFLRRLGTKDLIRQANVICVGREVVDEQNRPDLRQLYEGRDPRHFAARLDFFVWFRNPSRAWSMRAIGDLFDFDSGDVRGALASRTKYAGEDLEHSGDVAVADLDGR